MKQAGKVTTQDVKAAPKVVALGTCVVERDGKGFLVMTPDGSVKGHAEYHSAVKYIKKYFAKHTPADAIGVGQITTYDGSGFPVAARNGYVTEIG